MQAFLADGATQRVYAPTIRNQYAVSIVTTAPPEPTSRLSAVRNRIRRSDVEPKELVVTAGTAVAGAAARAYKSGVDRLLTAPERVTSVADALALLESDEHFEELSDRVQKVALAAVPMLRIARGAGRFARIPGVLVASTALAAGMTVRRGIRELQVIAGSRLTEAGGGPRQVVALDVPDCGPRRQDGAGCSGGQCTQGHGASHLREDVPRTMGLRLRIAAPRPGTAARHRRGTRR